jgi:hypothetical protein
VNLDDLLWSNSLGTLLLLKFHEQPLRLPKELRGVHTWASVTDNARRERPGFLSLPNRPRDRLELQMIEVVSHYRPQLRGAYLCTLLSRLCRRDYRLLAKRAARRIVEYLMSARIVEDADDVGVREVLALVCDAVDIEAAFARNRS